MQKTAFLLALLLATQAWANDAGRCGTDAFGNDVCLDKDGVLSNAPGKSAVGRSGKETNGKDKPAGSIVEVVNGTHDEEKNSRVRCGTDPFGNTVCRQ